MFNPFETVLQHFVPFVVAAPKQPDELELELGLDEEDLHADLAFGRSAEYAPESMLGRVGSQLDA